MTQRNDAKECGWGNITPTSGFLKDWNNCNLAMKNPPEIPEEPKKEAYRPQIRTLFCEFVPTPDFFCLLEKSGSPIVDCRLGEKWAKEITPEHVLLPPRA